MKLASNKSALKLCFVAVAMFGFGYALVPLYDVLCDITGLNGKTGEISQSEAETNRVDVDRLVTVEFDTNVNSALPWKFKAVDKKLVVHPGKVTEAVFIAVNTSASEVTGQAVPSVAPAQASLYFNKTECFCFSRQTLAAHEQKKMVVRFVVETDLPKKISTLTLSYTFFVAPEEKVVDLPFIAAEPAT